MNDEIREILDNPKILQLSYGNYVSLDDYNELKFVYENDVQEIKALVETMKYKEMDFCKLHDEVEDYEQRIKKAVEYIKNDMPYLQETDKEYEDMNGDTYFTYKEWDDTVLLNILQNGSENNV